MEHRTGRPRSSEQIVELVRNAPPPGVRSAGGESRLHRATTVETSMKFLLNSLTLASVLAAAVLVTAPRAQAQEQPGSPPVELSQGELESFADAAVEVQRLETELNTDLEAADSPGGRGTAAAGGGRRSHPRGSGERPDDRRVHGNRPGSRAGSGALRDDHRHDAPAGAVTNPGHRRPASRCEVPD